MSNVTELDASRTRIRSVLDDRGRRGRVTTADGFDTPIMREAAAGGPGAEHRRRPRLPQARAPARHHRRQPEGRRRQDDHDGQPRRRAGPARAAGAGHRPRPAGQRDHRRSASSTPAGRRRSTTCWSTSTPLDEVAVPVEQVAGPLVRAGDHRPRRRRDRAGLAWSPASTGCAGRSPAYGRRRRLHPHRLPAVARPAHRQRAGRRATRCSSRSSASTTRWRVWASCCRTSSWSGRTSTRDLQVSTILLTMYDAPHPAGRPGRRRRCAATSATRCSTRSIPRSVRVSEAPGYGQIGDDLRPGSRGAR